MPSARIARFFALAVLNSSAVVALGLASTPTFAESAEFAAPVAGLQPDRRPERAPVMRTEIANDAEQTRRRYGIAEPLPSGLGFLKDQGAWYTPFSQPGMPAPYDLRGWHRKP